MARRSGLGKGLDALIPADLSEEADGSLYRKIDLAHIVPNRFQPRRHFEEESLAALAASISEIGLIQPIVVREMEQGYEILTGERRWRASQRAGLTKIPALVTEEDDKGALEVAVVENLHREDLNALEEAAAFQQLMKDFGMTQAEVAARVGRSRPAVANTIRLLDLPPGVQRLVVDGKLSAGHGRALLAVEGDDARQALAEEIVKDQLSVREVERRVASDDVSAGESDAPEPAAVPPEQSSPTRAGILELEELLKTRLDTGVSVRIGRGKGRIMIQFADLTDLERIYNIITPPGTLL